MRALGRPATLVGADAVVLVAARPDLSRLATDVCRPRAWIARQGTNLVCAQLATAALWLLALWVAVGLLALAATRLPGVGGRWATASARVLLPRAVRAVLAGSAGLGVLLAPVAAGAAGSAPAAVTATHSPATPTVPTPTWPLDSTAHRAAPAPVHPRQHANAPADEVTVRPGDSLWVIAARRLGPAATPARIAAAWPRWYAANRSVIGDDPTVITPGQVLHAPDASPARSTVSEAS